MIGKKLGFWVTEKVR